MASRYRTTSAVPIDYMYRINTPLMQAVISANDQYITNQLGQSDQLGQLAQFPHLVQDSEAANAITKRYTGEVDDISNKILSDPANWRKQAGAIRDLKRNLMADYTGGPIAAYTSNFNARKKAFDEADAQVKLWNESGGTKGRSPEDVQAFKSYWDKQFSGTNYTSPSSYNIYKGGVVPNFIDVPKVLDEAVAKIKADKSNMWEEKPDGTYFLNKITNKVERVTPQKVLQVAMDSLDPRIMSYLKQDSTVGLNSGVFDESGKFIMPYNVSNVTRSSEEQAMIDDMQARIDKMKPGAQKEAAQDSLTAQIEKLDARTKLDWTDTKQGGRYSYLAPILRKLVGQYAYTNVEGGNDLSTNTPALTQYTQGQAWARQSRQLSQAQQFHNDAMKNADRAFEYQVKNDQLNRDLRKYEIDKKGEGKTKTGAKAAAGTSKTPEKKQSLLPETTGVDKIENNTFKGWTTTAATGEKVPVLSTAGLTADIKSFKDNINSINKQIAQLDKNILASKDADYIKRQKDQRDGLKEQLGYYNDQLNFRRRAYDAAHKAALGGSNLLPDNDITTEDRQLYEKYVKDYNGTQAATRAQDLIRRGQEGIEAMGGVGSSSYIDRIAGYDNMTPAQRTKALEARKAKYNSYEALIKEGMGIQEEVKTYKNSRQRINANMNKYLDRMSSNTITSDAIRLSGTDSEQMADLILNNPTGLEAYDNINGKKLGNGLTFTQGYGSDKPLREWMDENGVTMNVERIGLSTGLGNGNAVAEVTFNTPSNMAGYLPDKLYVPLTDNLQNAVVQKFRGNKGLGVADIANDMGTPLNNYIRKSFAQPSITRANQGAGATGEDEPFKFMMPTASGNVPLEVTRTIVNGQDQFFITGVKDGKTTPIPRLKIGRNGTVVHDESIPDGTIYSVDDFIQQINLSRLGTR